MLSQEPFSLSIQDLSCPVQGNLPYPASEGQVVSKPHGLKIGEIGSLKEWYYKLSVWALEKGFRMGEKTTGTLMSFLRSFLFPRQRFTNFGKNKNPLEIYWNYWFQGLPPPPRFWFCLLRYCSEICPFCKDQIPMIQAPYVEKHRRLKKDASSSSQSLLYFKITYQITVCRGRGWPSKC